MKHPQTLITLKPHYDYNLQGDAASQLLLRNTHLHTFNSDWRTVNDYHTFNMVLYRPFNTSPWRL